MHLTSEINFNSLAMLLGCTPLHWAALRGNVEACIVLVHAGDKQELMVKDRSGFTPAQLASEKGHRHVARIIVRIDYYSYSISISCLHLFNICLFKTCLSVYTKIDVSLL